jgi:hypothetical protein
MGNMRDSAHQSEPVVLVVEDESIIRMHAVVTIEEAGSTSLKPAMRMKRLPS